MICVKMESCLRVLNGKGIRDEWQTSVLVSVFKGTRDEKNCNTYVGVKLSEHVIKIVGRLLERRTRQLVNVDAMQFGFMPGRGRTDALFEMRRTQVN